MRCRRRRCANAADRGAHSWLCHVQLACVACARCRADVARRALRQHTVLGLRLAPRLPLSPRPTHRHRACPQNTTLKDSRSTQVEQDEDLVNVIKGEGLTRAVHVGAAGSAGPRAQSLSTGAVCAARGMRCRGLPTILCPCRREPAAQGGGSDSQRGPARRHPGGAQHGAAGRAAAAAAAAGQHSQRAVAHAGAGRRTHT